MSKKLSVFAIAMITMSAIVSLRNLPVSAELGMSVVFYYTLAAFIFFIPTALITAELAAKFKEDGGCYAWVSRAFNKPIGFLILWFSWMANVAWFPAILLFTVTMLGHMLDPIFPGIAYNQTFILSATLILFWTATILNFFGINFSSYISSLGVILGTLIPGVIIIVMGAIWIFRGLPLEINLTYKNLIPNFSLDNLVIFAGVMLSLAGVELAAYHIKDVDDPSKSYPKAIMIAAFLILFVYILGTLSIVFVVPQENICLASGLIQAFSVFFTKVGLSHLVPLLAFFLFFGSIAGINSWIVGPAKGMLVVANDGFLPPILTRVNKYNVPYNLLVLQGIVGSLLSVTFLYLGDKSSSIWILTVLSSQFTFMQYIFVALSAVILRKTVQSNSYKAPALSLLALLSIISCSFGFIMVYLPPSNLIMIDSLEYFLLIFSTFGLLAMAPLILIRNRNNFN